MILRLDLNETRVFRALILMFDSNESRACEVRFE